MHRRQLLECALGTGIIAGSRSLPMVQSQAEESVPVVIERDQPGKPPKGKGTRSHTASLRRHPALCGRHRGQATGAPGSWFRRRKNGTTTGAWPSPDLRQWKCLGLWSE